MKTALVTGFSSFPGVDDNPTEHVARAIDGQRTDRLRVVGRVLPVAWVRGPELAIATAREVGADLVVGLGVAVRRSVICVERQAFCEGNGMVDIDGSVAHDLSGPPVVASTLDCATLATALGAELSDDAGRYVCNAWLYRVRQALHIPVGFVHVPPAGVEVERLLCGLDSLLAG